MTFQKDADIRQKYEKSQTERAETLHDHEYIVFGGEPQIQTFAHGCLLGYD